jgi:endoglucanase
MKLARHLVVLCAAAFSAGVSAQLSARPVLQPCASVAPATCAIAHDLGRGINMGNMLEAPREGDWGVKLEPGYVDLVARAFKTVRVPVRWSNHAAATADATLDEEFAVRVDGIVDAFLARGLYVILDLHHYNQISGETLLPHEFRVAPGVLETRLENMWRQIALRYRDHSPKLLFELLNEPHSRLDGKPWNALAARTLAAVRASNPERTVLIGPSYWNNASDLKRLRLPADRNLITVFHNFHPFEFTHQGEKRIAKPFPTGITCCTPAQRRSLVQPFIEAQRWSRSTGYPMHLGEFGATELADVASRAAYTRLARQEAERRGMGWAYWEFASTFGVFDPKAGAWIEPLRAALLD